MFNSENYATEVSTWPISKIKQTLSMIRQKLDLAKRRNEPMDYLNACESVLTVTLMVKSPKSYSSNMSKKPL